MNIQRPAAAPRVANSRYTPKLLPRLPQKRRADAEATISIRNHRHYKILMSVLHVPRESNPIDSAYWAKPAPHQTCVCSHFWKTPEKYSSGALDLRQTARVINHV